MTLVAVVERALYMNGGNRHEAAAQLDLGERTLYRWLREGRVARDTGR